MPVNTCLQQAVLKESAAPAGEGGGGARSAAGITSLVRNAVTEGARGLLRALRHLPGLRRRRLVAGAAIQAPEAVGVPTIHRASTDCAHALRPRRASGTLGFSE